MIFDALVFGHIRRDGLRAAIALASIACAVALALALEVAGNAAATAFATSVDTLAERVDLAVVGDVAFDERVLRRVRAVPGVDDARPVTLDTLVTDRGDVNVRGVDLFVRLPNGLDPRAVVPGPFAATGSAPSPETLVRGDGALVSASLARRLDLRPGRAVAGEAHGRRVVLRMAGILGPAAGDVDRDVAFVDIATAQRAFGKTGRLDRIECVVARDRRAAVRAALRAFLPRGLRVVEPATRAMERVAFARAFRRALTAFVRLALGAGGTAVASALAISVVRRRPEIGTLRALGATRREIFTTFLAEGALYGATGSLAGLGLGMLAARAFVPHLLVGVDGVGFAFGLTARAFATGTGLALAAALVPAREAARVPAAHAMAPRGFERRPSRAPLRAAAATAGVAALAAFALHGAAAVAAAFLAVGAFVPPALACVANLPRSMRATLPLPVALGLQHLATTPRRTLVAVASLAIAVATTVALATFGASFRASALAWARRAAPGDFRIVGRVDARTRARVDALRDVARVRDEGGTIVVDAAPHADQTLRARLVRALADDRIALVATADVRATLVARLENAFAATDALVVVALALAFANVATTTFAVVLERREEIAVLRVLGLTTRAIAAMIACESAVLGALGASAGVALGLSFAASLVDDARTAAGDLAPSLHVPASAVAAIGASAVLCAVAAGWYPARRAARAFAVRGTLVA